MTTVAGYRIDEVLYGSGTTTVYRATRESDAQRVVLKWLSLPTAGIEEVGRFRHAYAIGNDVDVPFVARTLGLTEHEHRPVLVMEDAGSKSLRTRLGDGPLGVREVVRLGIEVATGLGHLHAKRVVHKDINPSNIMIGDVDARATIIDFDIASRLARETTDTWSTRALQGTLDYISPEQTGRMNRSIDHRTDLYSLGATLYEALVGHPPFRLDDPVALVHHHIAVVPEAPHVLSRSVPEAVSLCVMRLLAKTPEDRYQTAAGVVADLERCLSDLDRFGRVAPFELGTRDLPATLRVSERLYGRDDESERLLGAFRRAHEGRAELLLVGGYAGVGKTRLVRELYRPITADHGFFASGKFDQVTTTPYDGLVEAFTALVRGVLAEPEDRIAHWRATLEEALGGAAQIVVDVIPELELVLGPQQAVAPLPAAESRNRFQRTFQRFVRAFASPDHPLVLFLDDLQWADSASLELLQLLLGDPNTTHLLVVGAYRDNEVGAGHPLKLALEALGTTDAVVSTIELAPLDRGATSHLVADTLRTEQELALPLAEAVYERTRGNPFFVERLLEHLHRDGALWVDPTAKRWAWDLARIEALGISDNVADLMTRRIRQLPDDTQRILHIASCIGNTFDLATLATVSSEAAPELVGALWPAVESELVRPVGQAWSYLDSGQSAAEVIYRFVHDRIQEASYQRGDDAARRAAHLRFARLLLDGAEAPDDQRLFEVVAQYNLGRTALTDPEERLRLARLDLAAGRKALESGAYSEGRAYLRIGRELLPDDAWAAQQPLTFDLAKDEAQAELLCGDFEAATAGFDSCMDHAADIAQKVAIHCQRIDLHTRMSDHAAAIQAGLEGLVHFGFTAPDSPEGWQAATGGEIGAVGALLESHPIPGLVDAPACTDEKILLELRLLAQIGTPAYTNPAVFGFVTVRVVHLSIEHGNSPDSPLAYMLYGFMLCTMGQYEVGEAFGRLALALNDKKGSLAGAAPLNHLMSVFVEHWRQPLAAVRERVVKARRLALESGIFSTAGWVVMNVPWFAYVQADPLVDALDETRTNLDIAVNTLKADDVANSIRWTYHQLLKLAGQDELRDQLGADGFGEDALFEKLAHFVPMLGAMRVQRIMAAVILRDYAAAAADLPVAEQLAPTFAGSVWQSEYALYASLVTLTTSDGPDEEARAKLDGNLQQLQGWATHSAENHAWKRDLLAAELAVVDGDDSAAATLFDQAIEAAQAQGFQQGVGLACERAASFFASRGKARYARGYVSDAYFAYASWGAGAKVQALEASFPELRPRRGTSTTKGRTFKSTTTKSEAASFLDVATVLKATRAISRELVLEDLLRSLMSVVIENAGATRGALVLRRRDELVIEATADASAEPQVMLGTPLDEGELAASIVRFAARSREAVVLGDASAPGRFDQDTYVARAQPRSVLATPILNQGQLVGVLYLENNLTTDAFTEERCVLLDMLSAQAAISIQNAQLYDSLERFVPREFLACLGRPSILDVELGDAVERHMGVLFSDIRSFTTRSAGMTPQENFRFLNGYLRRVGPVIREHNGFIDKYIGDAIMALFPGSVADAIRCAIRMNEEAARYSSELEAAGGDALEIGVGVHHGKMVLGTIGEDQRIEGTVISDAVNTGARLESYTKSVGVRVLVSGEALDQLADRSEFAVRHVGDVVLRGRSTSTALYEAFDCDGPALRQHKLDTKAAFEAGIQAAGGGDTEAARAALEGVVAANADDLGAKKALAGLDG